MLSRRTLLVIYDVLHYFCLNGTRLRRDDVVEYLHRATTSKPSTSQESRLRAFERFKKHLRSLAVPHRVELESGDVHTSWLCVPNPDLALARVSRLLASTPPRARFVHVS